MSWRVRNPRVRAIALAGAAVVVVAAASAATLGLGGRDATGGQPSRTGPAKTVPVTRETLVKAVTLAGTLHYGAAVPLASTAGGTVTWLPKTGAVIRRGGVLLRADERPVLLMYGQLPMYRQLADGSRGADVAQFERNLTALDYGGFTVDDLFSAATVRAVKHWQEDLGLPQTGTVERERVIFAPDAVRVAAPLVRLGASATGDVLSCTGNTKLVTVAADAGDISWAAKGTAVTIALPGGTSTAGTVTGVGTAAQPAQQRGEPGSTDPGTGGATMEVTIAVRDQQAVGKLASAPVDVRYVAQRRPDVLTVPVSALLALAEGGYGVEVVAGGRTRIVAVRPGLFANGRVEVSGDGLAPGIQVGVPA